MGEIRVNVDLLEKILLASSAGTCLCFPILAMPTFFQLWNFTVHEISMKYYPPFQIFYILKFTHIQRTQYPFICLWPLFDIPYFAAIIFPHDAFIAKPPLPFWWQSPISLPLQLCYHSQAYHWKPIFQMHFPLISLQSYRKFHWIFSRKLATSAGILERDG